MTKKEFLEKYDNEKPYGWVCALVTLCPPSVYYSPLAVGMTEDEAKQNAIKNGNSLSDCDCGSVSYYQVTEAAYRKLKSAKTMNSFDWKNLPDGKEVVFYK